VEEGRRSMELEDLCLILHCNNISIKGPLQNEMRFCKHTPSDKESEAIGGMGGLCVRSGKNGALEESRIVIGHSFCVTKGKVAVGL
jgi:hypothetical protein